MGITRMETCRYLSHDCDVPRFKAALDAHPNRSAIVLAGGGNFNDYYWDDLPSKVNVSRSFPDVPIRSLPQSIYIRDEDHIKETILGMAQNNDAILSARDQPSYDWLKASFGDEATLVETNRIQQVLSPDIAFMWGPRPDFRKQIQRTVDVLFILREDMEVLNTTASRPIPKGKGTMNLAQNDVGDSAPVQIAYDRFDWRFIETPNLKDEMGMDQRASAKAHHGFEIISKANFVVTDRLHVHILSTLVGIPHVLLDSKLGKNFAYFDTWTSKCDCVRIARNMDEAIDYARKYFMSSPEKKLLDSSS